VTLPTLLSYLLTSATQLGSSRTPISTGFSQLPGEQRRSGRHTWLLTRTSSEWRHCVSVTTIGCLHWPCCPPAPWMKCVSLGRACTLECCCGASCLRSRSSKLFYCPPPPLLLLRRRSPCRLYLPPHPPPPVLPPPQPSFPPLIIKPIMSPPPPGGAKERRDKKFAAPCKHTTGCTDFNNSSCKGLKKFMLNYAMTMEACSEDASLHV